MFVSLLKEFQLAFDLPIPGYNGATIPIEGLVNIGPVEPPQHKGHVSQYSRDQLNQLQTQFDKLESRGVFRQPKDLKVVVEYLNPSFLVKKRNGGFCLVTAFTDVGHYNKPQPLLMPELDFTLFKIACWKYIIVSDLSQVFYEIPLAKNSTKYFGVVTPFKGVHVYLCCAMGIPGFETTREELMCRFLGNLVQEGCVTNYKRLLTTCIAMGTLIRSSSQTGEKSSRLWIAAAFASPAKTIIWPALTTILGWIWSQDTISRSKKTSSVT